MRKIINHFKPTWSVRFLVSAGSMSVFEDEEFYSAWTKKGAWRAFRRHHGNNSPRSYQCNFGYADMKNDISKVRYHGAIKNA